MNMWVYFLSVFERQQPTTGERLWNACPKIMKSSLSRSCLLKLIPLGREWRGTTRHLTLLILPSVPVLIEDRNFLHLKWLLPCHLKANIFFKIKSTRPEGEVAWQAKHSAFSRGLKYHGIGRLLCVAGIGDQGTAEALTCAFSFSVKRKSKRKGEWGRSPSWELMITWVPETSSSTHEICVIWTSYNCHVDVPLVPTLNCFLLFLLQLVELLSIGISQWGFLNTPYKETLLVFIALQNLVSKTT